MKRWFGLTLLWLLAGALLLITVGCGFFGSGGGSGSAGTDWAGTLTGGMLLAERTINTDQGTRIEVERSKVVIPAGAREAQATVKWYRIPAASSSLVLPSGWSRRSDDYRLEVGDSEDPFLQPIRVTLPFSLSASTRSEDRFALAGTAISSRRAVGMFSPSAGWLLLSAASEAGDTQAFFETWRPGIWVALSGNTDELPSPDVLASPAPLIAGADGRFSSDLTIACRAALSGGAAGLIASGEWGLFLRGRGVSSLDLLSADGASSRRVTLDSRSMTPRLDLLSDPLVTRTWGLTTGTATFRLNLKNIPIGQAPRRLLWESRLRLPSGISLLGEGEIGILPSSLGLQLIEPSGQIVTLPTFRWRATPDLTGFRRMSLELGLVGSTGEPLLAIDLAAPAEEWSPSTAQWNVLPQLASLEWRVIGIDPDGRRVSAVPISFLIAPGGSGTATATATSTGTGTGIATDSQSLATPPRVILTIPVDQASGVSPLDPVTIGFDRDLIATSVESGIRLQPAGTTVRTGWTDAKTLVISPVSSFVSSTRHTIEIASGVLAANGGRLTTTFTLSFTTGFRDLINPSVLSVSPVSNATKVPPNTWVAVTFSEPMGRASVESAIRILRPAVGSLSFLWGDLDRRLEFLPIGNWPASAAHEILLGSGASDLAGNRLLQDLRLVFTTRAETGPTLRSSVPAAGAVLTQATRDLLFQFDRTMDRSSTEKAFRLSPVPSASPSYNWASGDSLLTVRYPADLLDGASHTARIEASALDTQRLSLAGEVVVPFSIVDLTPPRIIGVSPDSGTTLAANAGVRVTFSEPVDQGPVVAAITISPPGASPLFAWNDRGDELTITPVASWPASATLGLTIGTGARDRAGNLLAVSYSASWPTAALVAPKVVRTVPVDGTVGVSRTASLRIEFDAAMDADSLAFGFSLSPAVAGGFTASWSTDGRILDVIQTTSLGNAVSYELLLGTELRNRQGTALAVPARVRFTTADTVPPVVMRSVPADGTSGVDPWTALEFTFDEPPRRSSAEAAFRLAPAASGTSVFQWSGDGLTMRVQPGDRLATGTRYSAGFGTGLSDLSGNQLLQDVLIGFTVLVASAPPPPPPPPPAPQVDAGTVQPGPGAVAVATQSQVRMSFSLPMDHGGTESAFSLRTGTGLIAGTFAWEGEVLVFTPGQPLADGTLFTIGLSTAARDRVNGQALASGWISTFTTAVSPAPPVMQSTIPASGAVGVDRNTLLQIQFSKPMASATVMVGISPPPSGVTLASWSADLRLLSLFSTGGFGAGTLHQVILDPAARSLDGIALSGATGFTFTTGIATPPRILSVQPPDGAVDVASSTVLQVVFDREMDQARVQAAISLTPTAPGGPQFSWNAGGDTVEIRAGSSWTAGVTYQFSIATGARDLAGTAMTTSLQSGFSVLAPPPVLPPTVLATGVTPLPGATGIATDTLIDLLFSRPMNAGVTAQAFALRVGVASIAGTVSWPDSAHLRFQPSVPLTYEAVYRIEVSTAAQDQDGRALAETWVSTFTVLAATLPRLLSTAPIDGADGVAVNSPISLTFSKTMATATVFLSWNPLPAGSVATQWSNGNRTMTVTWDPGLGGATLYQVALDAASRDVEGLPLAGGTSFGFRTGTGEAPRITSATPAEGASEISRSSTLSIVFDRAMEQGSVPGATLLVPSIASGFSYSWSGDGKSLTLTPGTPFAFGTTYQLLIGTGARDLLLTPLAQPFLRAFTTEVRPMVLASGTSPDNGATNVATTAVLTVAFNKPMDHSAVEGALALTEGGTPVAKAVSWSGNTILVTPPAAGWTASRTFVLSMTTAAADPVGNTLAAPFSRSFTTRRLYGSVWREILAHNPSGAQFPPRTGAVVISFQGFLWVIGGYDGADYRNDVWKSVDGVTWQQVLALDTTPGPTQFSGRSLHAGVVGSDGKLYMTGGQNEDGSGNLQFLDDVWVTSNGATWTKLSASAEYWARKGHMMVANAGKLYILAGETIDATGTAVLLGDTWESSNGINWTEKSNAFTTGFFGRREGAAGVLGGKLWVWAGYGTNAFGQTGPLNDAWSSTNGVVWVRATENASYTPRFAPAFSFHSGKYWMAGGLGQSGGFEINRNDVWYSSDGLNWTRVCEEAPADVGHFSARSRAGLAELGGKLYFIGGEDSWESRNDVRVAE